MLGFSLMPGFGLAEFAGTGTLIIASVWSLLTWSAQEAFLFILSGIFISAIISSIIVKFLPRSIFRGPLVLEASETSEQGFVASTEKLLELKGLEGECKTDLHPVGDVIINSQRFPATARDGFLKKGTEVIVTNVKGNAITVAEKDKIS